MNIIVLGNTEKYFDEIALLPFLCILLSFFKTFEKVKNYLFDVPNS